MTMSYIAPNLAEPTRRQGVTGRCRRHRQWRPKLPQMRSRNGPERCCCTFGQTAELAAQTGDKHVSWIAFPSGAEERCSPHRFVTPALHANHNQQTITAEVQPPAGLALLSAFAYHHRDIGKAQRPMLPGFERIHFSDSYPCGQIANTEAHVDAP